MHPISGVSLHGCTTFRSHKIHGLARLQLSKTARLVLAVICAISMGAPAFAETPAVGAKAPDFTLSTPTGSAVRMSQVQRGHDLVLVVLRGFPGYQCPYCVRQVHDFVDHASEFRAKNTQDPSCLPWAYRRSRPACQGIPGEAGRVAVERLSRDGSGLYGDQSVRATLGRTP